MSPFIVTVNDAVNPANFVKVKHIISILHTKNGATSKLTEIVECDPMIHSRNIG